VDGWDTVEVDAEKEDKGVRRAEDGMLMLVG
jgi:hypothetical protein